MGLYSIISIFALGSLLVSIALASPQPGVHRHNHPAPEPTMTQCYTTMVWNPPKQRWTHWSSIQTSCTKTSTITKTTTITPTPSTSTIISTTTTTSTALATTDTVTTTATSTTTQTDSTTTTSTATTSTTTSIVSTSTIPASAGFLPIQTTVPGSDDSLAYPNEKRDAHEFGSPIRTSSNKTLGGGGLMGGPREYGDVCCYHYWGRCTMITTTTTVTSKAPTPTSTITTTSTVTVTTTPGAVTTVTTTSTQTDTTTSTATTTTTETDVFTSFTSSTTVYGACQTPNRADQVLGQAIENGTPDASLTAFGINSAARSSAYDCCVAAILEPSGAYWGWHEGGEYCVIFSADSCDAGQASGGNGQVDTQSDAAPAFVLGNAYCGTWNTLN